MVSPKSIHSSAQQIWSLIGQESLNADLGHSTSGLQSTSGLFNLWLAQGFTSAASFKLASFFTLSLAVGLVLASYLIMHIVTLNRVSLPLSPSSIFILLGLSSLLWSGHLIHISYPIVNLIFAGISYDMLPSPEELITYKILIYEKISTINMFSSSSLLHEIDFNIASLSITPIIFHHIFVGITFIISGVYVSRQRFYRTSSKNQFRTFKSWHSILSYNLYSLSFITILFAQITSFIPVYPYITFDYATTISLFTHHI